MSEYFIGRQPILDQYLNLHAYELLFRNGEKNFAPGSLDDDSATSQVIITAFTEIGLEKLVGNRLAFVNTPYKFLCNPDLLPMEPDQVVLEILENVTIDDASVKGIKALIERGFTMALDDFIYSPVYDQILPLIDLIKLDITQIERSKWQETIDHLRGYGCEILAEKVETEDEYLELKSYGVDYYQGYFFAKPKVLSGKRITSNKITMLQLLAKMQDSSVDVEELSELISRDVGISVKALNYVNSPASGLNRHVESVREAVVFLGRDSIKKWVTLIVLSSVDDKPQEIMTMGLVRAKFCELLASKSGLEGEDAFFTVGLFSILDSLLDVSLEDALEPMAVTVEMRDALLNHKGHKGQAVTLAIELEQGSVGGQTYADMNEFDIANTHVEARNWVVTALEDMGA